MFEKLSVTSMRNIKGGEIIDSGGSGTIEDPYWTLNSDGTTDIWPPTN